MHCDTKTSTMEMKQTGTIDQIIEAFGLDYGKVDTKWKPAEGTPLVKDEDRSDAEGDFNYVRGGHTTLLV